MRKLAVVGAFSMLAAGPAFAQGSGFYVGAELGAVLASEMDTVFTPAVGIGTTGNVSTDHKLGPAGSAFAGYDFGSFRIEAEVGQLSADIEELTSSFALGTVMTAGSQDAGGEIRTQTLMANAMLDVGSFSDFTFFVGGGVGRAKLEVKELQASAGTSALLDDESEWRDAWQGIVGFRKPLASNFDLNVRYRYLNLDGAEMIGAGGRVVEADFTGHTLAVGVTYNF